MMKPYPNLLRYIISAAVITRYILTFLQQRFDRDHVNVYTNARVKEVTTDKVIFSDKGPDGKIETKELPMGFCLWSTGVCTF
jgi:NADH dehydrogenase